MVKLVHSLRQDKVQKDVPDASFILTNKKGGYLYLGCTAQTKYQGFFFNDDFRMYKILEQIRLPGKVAKLLNNFHSVSRERDNKALETFTLPFGYNSLIYELDNYQGEAVIELDCRESYDHDEWGRFYNISIEEDEVVISYEKQGSYRIFLVIKGKNLKAEKIREWKKREYDLDKARNSEYEMYIYEALKLFIQKDTLLVFSASIDKDKALEEADYVFRNINKLKRRQANSILYRNDIKDKEIRMAYNAALNSLHGLLVDINGFKGIFAGLPWFFQIWSRDELISLKGLASRSDVTEILDRHLQNIQTDGKLPTKYPSYEVAAADTIGWLYFRLNSKEKLRDALDALKKNYIKNGFLVNLAKETWMDSLAREGVRIEIQALLLNMYKLNQRKKEEEFRAAVRNTFWDGKYLADGEGDWTIRPNIFLAAYAYPELLSREEWTKCFKNALPSLWNSWGGLASVDKKNKQFVPESTGENPKSYHNGDSWFFMNNIAALVLAKTNQKEFKKYVEKILDASKNEILYSGVVGHAAEISSSSKLKSEGCLCQAWSAATFLELVHYLQRA